MRSICTLLLATFTLAAIACKKSKNTTGDYIVVGRHGGFAPVVDFYLVSNGQLRHDTLHKFGAVPSDLSKFQFDVVMPDAQYQKVAHLRESIPAELLTQNGKTFGEVYPDAQSLNVQTTINGTQYSWEFVGDQSKTTQPIRNFIGEAEKVFN